MSKATKKIAIGAAVAGAVGYVAGILTAPKSGKQTRADIKSAADEAANLAERRLKKMHTELSDLLDQAKTTGSKVSGDARVRYDDLMEKSKAAKQKAREVLSALHEGDSEDAELQKAVKDSTSAIDHLKTYLKKSA